MSGLAVAVAAFVLMVATEPKMAIVWDEGYTLGRLERMRTWLGALYDLSRFAATEPAAGYELVVDVMPPPRFHTLNTRAKLFDPKVLAWFWPFAREEPNGHPPFYAIVALVGDVLGPGLEELPRARLGTILVFSLTAGALFAFLARRWGVWPALAGAGAWTLQPRLFAHGHYASYDALLTALWVGSILAFTEAVAPRAEEHRLAPRWPWVIAFGVLAGWAAATKFTGWFLPVPFLCWVLLYRDRRGVLTLLLGGVVGLLTLYAFNPPWWGDPIAGVARFLRSSLTRGTTIRITVQFLGHNYATPRESLPWYNTLVWTLFVTPVGFLGLAVVGLSRACRRWRDEPFGVLAAGHWLFLLALRALPHTPGHDSERLFLPAFGCLALMAACGASVLSARWVRWLVVASIAEGAVSVALFMPVPLAYFSPAVGGPRGAVALGMEPTYYWDSLTDEALEWINSHTRADQQVGFATHPTIWVYLRRTRKLRAGLAGEGPGEPAWYVVQNRPGSFTRRDTALVMVGRSAYVIKKGGVPLLWIFPYSDAEASERAARRQRGRP